jgi:hypothetical protein
MSDLTSLQLKINDLKAKVANNSITPTYLGSLLDEFIKIIEPINDFASISEDLKSLRSKLVLLTPIRCNDEDDLKAKASSGDYAVGQQFYIPEI